MSKPVKNLIIEDYKRRFRELDGAVLIDIRGVQSNDSNTLRGTLAKKNIRVKVVQNSLAKRALDGSAMARIAELFDGPTAMVYGGGSVVEVAREIIEQVKTIPQVQIKGALMEGVLFPADQIDALSKYPTRAEAQAQVIQVVLGAAGQLLSAINVGGQIAAIVEAVEKKLEKGEAIAKTA
jgi:large subunit ribosomal protein L10